jgi:hypothetical protein
VLAFMMVIVAGGHAILPLGALMVGALWLGHGLAALVVWLGPLLLFASAAFGPAPIRAGGALIALAVVWYVWSGVAVRVDAGFEWMFHVSSVPLCIMSLGLTVVSIRDIVKERRWARVLAGRCDRCGYDLRASGGTCPECGTARAVPSPSQPPRKLRWPGLRELWARRPWANVS